MTTIVEAAIEHALPDWSAAGPKPVIDVQPIIDGNAFFEGSATMKWQDYISVDPNVCHGQACISGTRVHVTVILDNLAAGLSVDEIIKSYPSVSGDAVKATLYFAAELARERVVPLGA